MKSWIPALILPLALALALALALPAASLVGEWVHPYDFPQTDKVPDTFYAVIEIPAGGFTKYELDGDTGHVMVDRFVRMPVTYPANYGSITQTLGGDDDPLDVLVITREPLYPGVIVKARPVAILKSIDGGEVDDKIIAVPASKLDPTYDQVEDASDLPELDRKRIEAFFRVYKQLKSGKVVEVKGWADVDEAKKMIRGAVDAYRARHGSDG